MKFLTISTIAKKLLPCDTSREVQTKGGNMEKRIVARWEAKGGKRWLELYADATGYGYSGDGCGGNLGALASDADAIAQMEHPAYGAVTCLRLDFSSTRRTI